MSIRFKFRSSPSFDSINLNGYDSISVRDLRAKIIAQKKLQICKNFDLVISDADTGTPLEDFNQIKEGSSVVIKRVPAGLNDACHLNVGHAENVVTTHYENTEKENLDDFGVDLYANLRGSLPEPCDNFGNLEFVACKEEKVVSSFPKQSISRCKNTERSEISEAMSKEVIGDNCCKEFDIKETLKQTKLEAEKEAHKEKEENIDAPLPFTLDMDLPTELRCSLCAAIFKQAVMIPCCQHSFCEKCIRSALTERRRCPKCSSVKCTVDSLLPNLTLRQAIEHFLESQANNYALENKIPQFVPDEESGVCGRPVSSPLKLKQMKGDESCSAAVNQLTGSQGFHNSSKIPHIIQHEEANIASKKNMVIGVTVLDGNGTCTPTKHRKGDRNCYMCGSSSHLMRNCPEASHSYPLNQTGDVCFNGGMPTYTNPYWNVNSFPQARPYMNMYGTPGMMPFDATMGPISPFGAPPYMPPMYTSMPSPYGFMRMRGVQYPMTSGAKWHNTQDGEWKHKNGHAASEDDDYYKRGKQRNSFDKRHRLEEEAIENSSNSEYHSYVERRHKRGSHQSFSGRDDRPCRSENTNSESQEYSKERKRRHYRKQSNDQREKSRKEFSEDDEDVIMSHKKNNHRRHNDSKSKHRKEKETSHSSKSSRHKRTKNSKDEYSQNERWEMVDSLNDDEYRGVNYHKRRRAQ